MINIFCPGGMLKISEELTLHSSRQTVHQQGKSASLCKLYYCVFTYLEVKLPYDPVCPSMSVGQLVGLSVITSLKGRKFMLIIEHKIMFLYEGKEERTTERKV